jgi:hypothetical protein
MSSKASRWSRVDGRPSQAATLFGRDGVVTGVQIPSPLKVEQYLYLRYTKRKASSFVVNFQVREARWGFAVRSRGAKACTTHGNIGWPQPQADLGLSRIGSGLGMRRADPSLNLV